MKKFVWVENRTRLGTYSVRYFDPVSGKQMRVKVDHKEDLAGEVNRIEAMLLKWKPSDGKPYAVPLVIMEDYFKFLIRAKRRMTTIDMKRKHLTPMCESIFRMEQMTSDWFKAYIDGLYEKKYKADTIAIRMRDYRAFFNWLVKESILPKSPFTGQHIPPSTFVGRRLSKDEMARIFQSLWGNIGDFVVFVLETGVRRSEVFQAEFTDFDLERRYWNLLGKEGKSKSKRDRVIPLSQFAMNILLKRKQTGARYVFEGYTKNMMYNDWYAILTTAKVTGRVRPHDLRHTWASNFKGRASSLKQIAGWSTDQMMSHYQHVEVEELREDMEKNSISKNLESNLEYPDVKE